jgi:hypothetical protein
VILTTNFDLLTETALRQVGIEPVVLSSPGAIAGDGAASCPTVCSSASPWMDESNRKRLADLRETLSQLYENMSRCVRLGVPHIRTVDNRDGYTSASAQALLEEINRHGQEHPLVHAGLCDRNVDALKRSMTAVNAAFNAFANEAAWSAVPPQGGILPSSPFYPDEIGKWRQRGE